VSIVTLYLAQRYVSRTAEAQLVADTARVRNAAEEITREGTSIRYLRSIFVPAEELCFSLYEAPSGAAVREASDRAGLNCEAVVEAVEVA
jgi:hypothetical protein